MRADLSGVNKGRDGSPERSPSVENPLGSIDPRKIVKARELLGSLSDIEAIEVALDLLVLDDEHTLEWPGVNGDEL